MQLKLVPVGKTWGNVFSDCLKVSAVHTRSHSEFQTVGPATENRVKALNSI